MKEGPKSDITDQAGPGDGKGTGFDNTLVRRQQPFQVVIKRLLIVALMYGEDDRLPSK